jgi:elongation factor P
LTYDGQPIEIALPTTVDLKVAETAPGFKGDTASGGGKPATLETGVVITVPFFVNVDDTVRVDTRDGTYVTRV